MAGRSGSDEQFYLLYAHQGGLWPREHTAAAYEMETAQAQRRELEDSILKLEERFQGYQKSYAELDAQQAGFREELAQIEARSRQTEADTRAGLAQTARILPIRHPPISCMPRASVTVPPSPKPWASAGDF